jgi:predicted ribosome quality control (RQC) complex YloA/Tae2 family protein
VYSDFAPIHYLQITSPQKICQTFNECLDLYFSVMETKSEQNEFEQKAWKKFENIKQDQENRLLKLQKEQEEYLVKAGLIQNNVQDVDAIITVHLN